MSAGLIAAACSGSSASESGTTPDRPATPSTSTRQAIARDALTDAGRVDIDPTGNRLITGAGDLLESDPVAVQLDGTAQWIVAGAQASWIAVLGDGSSVEIQVAGDGDVVVSPTNVDVIENAAARPPVATSTGIGFFDEHHELFTDPLPDTRIVVAGETLIALAGPTDRYAHGVLGDELEASAIELSMASGASSVLVELASPDVFEAVSPMIADVNDDGVDDILATVSNSGNGARVVAYSLADGTVVAETEPIGQGNRWRNLLAVGPVGPEGQTEVIDVRTPHIGGVLQFFRIDGNRMELAASAEGYSTHTIGSRNLDLGIVSDANGDGVLDVILPTRDMGELVAITRDDNAEGGTRELGRVDLGGTLVTNLAAREGADGVEYAVGLDGGIVLVWP